MRVISTTKQTKRKSLVVQIAISLGFIPCVQVGLAQAQTSAQATPPSLDTKVLNADSTAATAAVDAPRTIEKIVVTAQRLLLKH